MTVVDPRSYMTYQPFLPEASAGSIQPRHTVVPLRQTLHRRRGRHRLGHRRRARAQGRDDPAARGRAVRAALRRARDGRRVGRAHAADPGPRRLGDRASRTSRRPSRCATACWSASTSRRRATDPEIRERNLTFVFVGGGYAGVEAIAETEDLARYATRYLRNVTPDGPALRARRGDRPDPARGRRRDGRAGPSSSCASAASTSSSRPGSSRPSRGTSCSPTARRCSPTPSSGPPACKPEPAARGDRTCRSTTAAG